MSLKLRCNNAKEYSDGFERIKYYLNNNISLKYANVHGFSFLFYCLTVMNEDLCIDIIKYGINIDYNECFDHGQTPLHVACLFELNDFIHVFLKLKWEYIDMYAITDDMLIQYNSFQCGGQTILHYASSIGSVELIQLIIKYELNKYRLSTSKLLHMKDFQNNSCLDVAIINNRISCAQFLSSLMGINLNDEYIDGLKGKRLMDSQQTKLRFDKINSEVINSKYRNVYIIDSIFSIHECKEILSIVMEYTNKHSWTSNRHRSYSTQDVQSASMNYMFDEYIKKTLHERLFPKIIEKYQLNDDIHDLDTFYVDIGFKDLFFVKYDVYNQNSLSMHRDGSIISFNILLNNHNDFIGGGTYFKHINKIITINQGQCVIHSGKLLHSGNAITNGERYILVGFLDVKFRKKIKIHKNLFQPITSF